MQTLKAAIGVLALAASLATQVHAQSSFTNYVLSLDGNGDSVSIPNAAELQNPTEITVEAWVYPQNNISGDVNGLFIAKTPGRGGPRSYELRWCTNCSLGLGTPTLEFHVFVDEANNSAFVAAYAPENTWTHMAARFSRTEGVLQLFTNGILAGTATACVTGAPLLGASITQTTVPLYFGTVDSQFAYAHGSIDEIRLWNKARTADEIYRNRFCRLTGTESNLVGYWTFDDGSAKDRTGHGHDGTFVGSAQALPIVGKDVIHAGECGQPPCSPHKATATATLYNWFLVDATITDGGCGYTNPPAVLVQGGGGSGAAATAVVSNGMVVKINITDAGGGYTSVPKIVIGSPPFVPTLGIAVSKVKVTENVVLGRTYVLESSHDLVTWTATGPHFTAQEETLVNEFDVDLTGRYFRIRQVTP